MTLFPKGDPAWAIRRRVTIAVLAFCGGYAVWAPFVAREALATTMILQAFLLAGAVVGFYIGGPLLDDHLKRKSAPPPWDGADRRGAG